LHIKHIKAKELLINSSLSISEIAYKLGFENISQFSTFFKSKEGATPSDFRKISTFDSKES
ncbi:MAG: helix-turn-helix domain-containing protein, partial [Bacteroidales bacterium]